VELRQGDTRRFSITPEDFGITPSPMEMIRGGDAKTNASIIEAVLNGERGPRRDVVLINAAAAIVAGGVAANLKEGIRAAESSIDTGAAIKKLRALREFS
jgi:anthranilate phosphoribosyltransferase